MKNSANLLFIFSTLFLVLCLFEENIWSAEEKKKGEGKKGNYLEKENICPQRRKIFVHVGEKTIEKEKDEIFGEGKTE